MEKHIPVLLDEVVSHLQPAPGKNFIDGTFGGGGHAMAILERIRPSGHLIVFDRDPKALERARLLGTDVEVIHGNFASLGDRSQYAVPNLPIHGVLLDCGISSSQLADPEMGLSFNLDAPLTMRLDRQPEQTAYAVVNSWSETDLANAIWKYGEERGSRRIARAVVAARREKPIETTGQLADIVRRAVGGKRSRIHPATKTFQALRIVVNDELGSLEKAIKGALDILALGGRAAIISFHSLEDRLVKEAFRTAARVCVCPPEDLRCTCSRKPDFKLLTKKPIVPSQREVSENPRSRSAKLRVIEKIAYAN